MSYILAKKIFDDRIEKSLAAYDKYVERNGVPTAEDMKQFLASIPDLRKKSPKLGWWGVKVYNGWLYTTEKRTIWS